MSNETLINLQENGVPATINYNTPESVAYDGTNIIELDVDPAMFAAPPVPPLSKAELAALTEQQVADAMKDGFRNPRLFPNLGVPEGAVAFADIVPGPDGKAVTYDGCYVTKYGPLESAATWVTDRLRHLRPRDVLSHLKERRHLAIFRLSSHRYDCVFLEPVPDGNLGVRQRIGIIEYYRLSSFLGTYGAGRTINTFSLLPGEKAKVGIKTFKKTTETRRQSSSILDSLNDSSSSDFESIVQEERSDRSTQARMDSWHVEGELTGNWGTGSAKIEAGYKGSASSARDQFAKNVGSSLEKHVMQASNKRDIKVEQSTEATTETGSESNTEREIRNINVGHTLNFVFRQMNQEFLTLLHLIDVRVGYTDGITTRVVPLHAIDRLLDEVIVTQTGPGGAPLPPEQQYRTALRQAILDEVSTVIDVDGVARTITETVALEDAGGDVLGEYVRLKPPKDLKSVYKVASTGTEIVVDGVVLADMYNVLRTDGIITEALLGRGVGLDPYSQALQQQTVRELQLKNDALEQQVARERAAQALVAAKDKAAVALLAQLYPPPPVERAP